MGSGAGGYVAFIGRMNADKGVHTAARIARGAHVPLLIAAKMREPAERAYFETAVVPLLGDGVEYIGELGGADKADLLANAQCLLNPIAWPEPFGMVMVEALGCGTPVLATPYGSVPEIVTDGVTGFVRTSRADLARALRQVRKLDRARCRQDALERFSTARMVAGHVELFEAIARNRCPALVT
jgi:glycosyltransferase involved in cell wall biosynthesis